MLMSSCLSYCISFNVDTLFSVPDKCDKKSATILGGCVPGPGGHSTGISSEWKQGKSKRVRTIFTPEQLERLEAEFERQQYMVGTERSVLSCLIFADLS